MHLAFDLSFTHTEGRWALPGGWNGYDYYPDPRFYQDMARLAERGRLDMLFFGDGTGIPDTWEGSRDGAVRWGIQWPRHDKSPLIPLMAAAAPNVGFAVTFSPTYMHPYYVARLLSSLDHLTAGRVALNLITSTRLSDAANYGFDALMEHEQRYERAEEFAQVCMELWDSVSPDAIVLDPETGVFADPDGVHAIDHHGDYWDVRGPLNCMPMPQGHPVMLQAGQSDRGIQSSARYAEMVFAGGGNLDYMRRHRELLDGYLVEEGRDPRDVGILWSTQVMLGESEAAARAKLSALADQLPLESGGVYLAHNSGFDFSTLGPKFTLGEAAAAIEAAQGTKSGFIHRLMAVEGPDYLMSLDELQERGRVGMLGVESAICGTAAQVADQLQELHENTGANGGFMIQGACGPNPRTLTDVVDLLVPELQRRGIYRTEYEGTTLRDRLTS
ncbi:MAG: NtaA/DmoA family FMN-dependent monooxygenase [Acidimicrobiia bacterium]|nr:NtaA/DmoA family FMN-dependent monooxygenase [Acidimicrobiia bacterium]